MATFGTGTFTDRRRESLQQRGIQGFQKGLQGLFKKISAQQKEEKDFARKLQVLQFEQTLKTQAKKQEFGQQIQQFKELAQRFGGGGLGGQTTQPQVTPQPQVNAPQLGGQQLTRLPFKSGTGGQVTQQPFTRETGGKLIQLPQSLGGQTQQTQGVGTFGKARKEEPFISQPTISFSGGKPSISISRVRNPQFVPPETRAQKIAIVSNLRKEFNSDPIIQSTKKITQSVARLDSVWNNFLDNPNPESKNALDQALVIQFNKLLDPGSVVRESEFARTPQGQSLVARFQGLVQKTKVGGVGLTDANRKELVDVARQLEQGQKNAAKNTITFFGKEADILGIDRARVLGIFGKEFKAKSTTTEQIDVNEFFK